MDVTLWVIFLHSSARNHNVLDMIFSLTYDELKDAVLTYAHFKCQSMTITMNTKTYCVLLLKSLYVSMYAAKKVKSLIFQTVFAALITPRPPAIVSDFSIIIHVSYFHLVPDKIECHPVT